MDSSPPICRVAMLSVHTSPLASLGAKKTGGMNVYIRDFSRELGRRGIQVDVFTRKVEPDQPSIEEGPGPNCRVISLRAGPYHTIPNDDVVNYLDAFADGVAAYAEEWNRTYDVIHSHYWLSGLVAERLLRMWGSVPFIHMYHTLGLMKNRIARDQSEFASGDRLMGEAFVAQAADRLIAATPAEQQQLQNFYDVDRGKITVLPPGVDLAHFQPMDMTAAKKRIGIPDDQRLLLFVGRIEPLKGIDTLLRAICLLAERFPQLAQDIHVALVGGDPHASELDVEMERLQQIHRNLNLHDLVAFWGAQDQKELPYYYAAAEAVIMPSHYESFGMVGLEAMAMQTPVIASRVGGLAHLVQHGSTGFLVPSQTPEALADRIYDLLSSPALRERMGRQAREHAMQFAWPEIVDRMLHEVYASLIRTGCYA